MPGLYKIIRVRKYEKVFMQARDQHAILTGEKANIRQNEIPTLELIILLVFAL